MYKKLRQEFTRDSFRRYIKYNLGEACVNCGTTNNVEYHHIVPLKNGGTNNLSNIVALCEECHYKAHDRSSFKNKNGGRPKVITFEQAENTLHKYFNIEIGKTETIQLLGINPKSHTVWDRLVKEYKSKHDIKGFYNNIDLLNSQSKRIKTTKNKKR